MSSLEEIVQEYRENPDSSNPFEWVLEIVILKEHPKRLEEYDDEGEPLDEPYEVELDWVEQVVGHEFLISWGGPESRLTTKNHGKSWTYSYCDWFGSDAWSTGLTGAQVDLMEQAFGIFFDLLQDSEKVGAWIE